MPMIWTLGHLILLQRFLMLLSFLFIIIIFFTFLFIILFLFFFLQSPPFISIFYLPAHFFFSISRTLLLAPSKGFLISVIALFITDWLFFLSSMSLLNIRCIFSIYVSSLFTARNTQRASQSYKDKGRQKRERGNQEQKRESQKGREWLSW